MSFPQKVKSTLWAIVNSMTSSMDKFVKIPKRILLVTGNWAFYNWSVSSFAWKVDASAMSC